MKNDDRADIIMLIGEIEHARRHLRIATSVEKDMTTRGFNNLCATRLRELRRDVMKAAGIEKKNWCIVKALAICRQLILEVEWDDFGNESEQLLANDLRYIDSMLGAYIPGGQLDYCSECDKKEDE